MAEENRVIRGPIFWHVETRDRPEDAWWRIPHGCDTREQAEALKARRDERAARHP